MGGSALVERVWTMFDAWQMAPSQIDRELCLPSGTAHDLIMQWIGYFKANGR